MDSCYTYKVLNKIAINFCLPFSFFIYQNSMDNELLYPIGAA
jgi:hypothetical protein